MSEQARRWAILGSAALVVALGVGAEWLEHGTRFGFAAQRDLLTGWAVAASGLVAWALVPWSRVGPLLVAAGVTWFAWNAGSVEGLGPIAAALTDLCAGFLAHALFTWPTGRVTRPLERVLVAGGYIVALFPPLWERDASLVIVAGLLAAGLVVGWAALPPRARHVRLPALALGLGLAATLTTKGALASVLRGAGVAYPGTSGDLWQIAVVVVAVSLTWSLVALDRRRRGAADLVVRLSEERPLATLHEVAEAAGLRDEEATRDALERAADMAARNTALREELAAQAAALDRSRRRLVEAGDAERADLEERLRLGPARRLARLEQALIDGYPHVAGPAGPRALAEAAPRIERAVEQLRSAQLELSELARGLEPALLREQGLEAALRDVAARSPVPVEVSMAGLGAVEPTSARTLYYVASEALANIAKHARAAHAWLSVRAGPEGLQLAVEDDGAGIDDRPLGRGLRGLADRVDALGGTFAVTGQADRGTRLAVTIPWPRDIRAGDATAGDSPARARA